MNLGTVGDHKIRKGELYLEGQASDFDNGDI